MNKLQKDNNSKFHVSSKRLSKIDLKLKFAKKRNAQILTPCCNKKNTDGKFVSYEGYNDRFGYCHSCGTNSLPPTPYSDEKGNIYNWNDNLNSFEKDVLQNESTLVTQSYYSVNSNELECNKELNKKLKHLNFNTLSKTKLTKCKNNLQLYLCNTYGITKANIAKENYHLGTSKHGGTVFWYVNKDGNIQKAKVCFYNEDGKRTDKFFVPFKNEDGYYFCLYGEHLLNLEENLDKKVVLVESEKTAIICSILISDFVWLSYGGINGLTIDKISALENRNVIIVPDISANAVNIIKKKLPIIQELGIKTKIWDMRNGKSDEELKKIGWYNSDLEDIIRTFSNL